MAPKAYRQCPSCRLKTTHDTGVCGRCRGHNECQDCHVQIPTRGKRCKDCESEALKRKRKEAKDRVDPQKKQELAEIAYDKHRDRLEMGIGQWSDYEVQYRPNESFGAGSVSHGGRTGHQPIPDFNSAAPGGPGPNLASYNPPPSFSAQADTALAASYRPPSTYQSSYAADTSFHTPSSSNSPYYGSANLTQHQSPQFYPPGPSYASQQSAPPFQPDDGSFRDWGPMNQSLSEIAPSLTSTAPVHAPYQSQGSYSQFPPSSSAYGYNQPSGAYGLNQGRMVVETPEDIALAGSLAQEIWDYDNPKEKGGRGGKASKKNRKR